MDRQRLTKHTGGKLEPGKLSQRVRGPTRTTHKSQTRITGLFGAWWESQRDSEDAQDPDTYNMSLLGEPKPKLDTVKAGGERDKEVEPLGKLVATAE